YPSVASSRRNFRSKSGTRMICLPVPLSLPKLVTGAPQWVTNFGNGGTGGGACAIPPDRPRLAQSRLAQSGSPCKIGRGLPASDGPICLIVGALHGRNGGK